jgi:hypothetical protein
MRVEQSGECSGTVHNDMQWLPSAPRHATLTGATFVGGPTRLNSNTYKRAAGDSFSLSPMVGIAAQPSKHIEAGQHGMLHCNTSDNERNVLHNREREMTDYEAAFLVVRGTKVAD